MTGLRLTARGLALLAFGALLVAGAYAVRDPALLWPGLVILMLVAGAAVVVALRSPGLAVRRELNPVEPTASEPVDVHLLATSRRSEADEIAAITETLPEGRPVKLRLNVDGGGVRRADYSWTPERRGRYQFGGPRYTLGDPFGLVQRAGRADGTTTVGVLPPVLNLDAARTGTAGRPGEVAVPRLALGGPDDVLIREYRPRDDRRRVHWPSTARTGTLMVRREEQAIERVARVLLDTRRDVDPEIFEWLVVLASSASAALIEGGYRATVTEASGASAGGQPSRPGTALLAARRHLIDVQQDVRDLRGGVRAGRGADQLMLALLGRLDLDTAEQLSALPARRTPCWALVATPPDAEAVTVLSGLGWHHRVVPPNDDPAPAWASLQLSGRW